MTLFPVYCCFLGWWQNVLGSSSCAQEWPLEEWRHCCVRLTAIGGHKRGFVPHLKRFILRGHKEWAPSWRTNYQYILPSPMERLINHDTPLLCPTCLFPFLFFFFQISILFHPIQVTAWFKKKTRKEILFCHNRLRLIIILTMSKWLTFVCNS